MAPRDCLLMTLDCVPHQVRETLAEAALALEAERADKAEAETAAAVAEEAVARMAQLAERGDQERVLQLSATVAELARWQTSAHAAWEEAGREVKRRQETELLEQAKQSAIVDLRARALIEGASSRALIEGASSRALVEGAGRVQGGHSGALPVGTSTVAAEACAGCTAGVGSTPRLSCSTWEQLQLSQLQLGACSGSVGAETGGQTGSAAAAFAFAAWATAPSVDVAASAELTAAREVLQGYQAMSRQPRDPTARSPALGGGEQLQAERRAARCGEHQLGPELLTPEGAARAQHGETTTSSHCSTRSLTTGAGHGLSSLARDP
jgi:hypothetical protein